MKNTPFYDRESNFYSLKRYPEKSSNFIQYTFKKRLSFCLNFINEIVKTKNNLSLLEIGCADGIVLRTINAQFKNFSHLIGIDISPKMIDVANSLSIDFEKISFRIRDKFVDKKQFSIVIEIGVLSLTNITEEVNYAYGLIENGGYYICSYGSKSSLYNKLKNDDIYSNNLSYSEFEDILKRDFVILKKNKLGLFFPKLWFYPSLGRLLQPMMDWIFSIFPNLFHEKIYLLKKLDRKDNLIIY